MNKKFLAGTIFGLTLGLGVGIATPMLGANNAPKNIVIKKRTHSVKDTNSSADTDKSAANGEIGMKDAVGILKEINDKLKDNSDTNKQILAALKILVAQGDVNPLTGEKK